MKLLYVFKERAPIRFAGGWKFDPIGKAAAQANRSAFHLRARHSIDLVRRTNTPK
jgi:hypothetical protein